MSFSRITALFTASLVIAMLLPGSAHATDISMANGSVNFSTPDTWLGIMETHGDPEVRVFQVPDPSPTGKTSLARVTVTIKPASSISDFHQYMAEATAKALELPGYKAAAVAPSPNSEVYTAQETGVQFSYTEHYWFKDGHAIQLRCVRPSHSLAGAAWTRAFDRGCEAIAARLK